MDFLEFPKIARLSRECVITEKIDGTNAQVFIKKLDDETHVGSSYVTESSGLVIYAGSRTRWITPKDDNFGFADWVWWNADELVKLGEGHHYGEWWGCGIQRKYDMPDKRWSLFNTSRWDGEDRPSCCSVVPTLYRGDFTTDAVTSALDDLRANGSKAAPGFMKPEGVVVYHTAANMYFKKTLEKDSERKGR